MPADGFSKTLI